MDGARLLMRRYEDESLGAELRPRIVRAIASVGTPEALAWLSERALTTRWWRGGVRLRKGSPEVVAAIGAIAQHYRGEADAEQVLQLAMRSRDEDIRRAATDAPGRRSARHDRGDAVPHLARPGAGEDVALQRGTPGAGARRGCVVRAAARAAGGRPDADLLLHRARGGLRPAHAARTRRLGLGAALLQRRRATPRVRDGGGCRIVPRLPRGTPHPPRPGHRPARATPRAVGPAQRDADPVRCAGRARRRRDGRAECRARSRARRPAAL